ncbi:MAG: hypothetical protein OSB18_10740 [SAR324 cluster bacterium]|nr:hypothetical protein [SAR324 cluster bacterium]HBI29668.1 hypothetical protein [Deltaproteobacteria bacterium]
MSSRIWGSLNDYQHLTEPLPGVEESESSPLEVLKIPAFRFWGCVLLALVPSAYLLLPNPFQ